MITVRILESEGSQAKIENHINSLGTNLIIIFPGSSKIGGVHRGAGSRDVFTLDNVKRLKEDATLISGVSPIVRSGGQIIGGAGNWYTEIFGVSTDYFEMRNWEIDYGELFTEKDIKSKRKVCLIGRTIADELFPDEDPTGEKIRIRNIPFTVAGVLKGKGQNSMGQDQDDIILAPSTTVLYRLKGRRYVNMINASSSTVENMEAAQEEIRILLREENNLEDGEDDNFTIRTQAEITDALTETSRTMTMLLGSIAAVSLLVGGIGIMNIMLVSVTERTREIGIRLSVGARASDILIQFLTEAVVLSLSGGIIGIILAVVTSILLNEFTDLLLVIKPAIIAISFIFSGAVGIFFGFYPARKASILNPIDALRYE